MIDLTGTTEQREQFRKRIKQPLERIATDVLEVIGLEELPIVFRITLRGNATDIQEQYRMMYNLPLSSVAFCSKSTGTIYISVADSSARLVAHEMAHHVINTYFTDPIPIRLHELIAQTVEEKVCKRFSSWWHW